MRRLQPGVRDRVQSSLLLHLRAAELGRSILRHQSRHSLFQRHTLQNPGGTPPLGIAFPLGDAGSPDLLVFPQLPAREANPNALGICLYGGDLPAVPPQPPALTILHPSRRARCGHEAGEVAGRKHGRRIRAGVSNSATARQGHAEVPGRCSGDPAPGLSCLRPPDPTNIDCLGEAWRGTGQSPGLAWG